MVTWPNIEVPFGYCHCGCGQRTNIAKEANRRKGHIAGQPMRFVRGHRARLPQFRPTGPRPGWLEHFWEQAEPVEGPLATLCWRWTGAKYKNGYGKASVAGRTRYAHRLAYEEAIGEIPGRAQVNHLCDWKNCIATNHLVLGSHTINARDAASKGFLNRKLRAGNVQEMRYLHREGWALPALAEKFSIAPESVKRIVATKTQWRHITEPDWEPAPMRCRHGRTYDGHRIDSLGRRMPTCSSTCRLEARERLLAYFHEYNRTSRPGKVAA